MRIKQHVWLWLKGRMHCSWHIAWVALGILLGIIAAARFTVQRYDLFLVMSVALTGATLWWRFRWLALFGLVAGGCLGMCRGSPLRTALQDYLPYIGQTVVLRGTVAEDAALGKRGDQRLHLSHIHIRERSLAGDIWASTASKLEIKRGDTVEIQGKLKPGFGTFAANMPRAGLQKVIRPHPGDIARVVRDWFADGVRVAIPAPQSALGIGYLTGQRTALPAKLDEQLRVVGLTHAVVASGYNLTILVGFARTALQGVSKYLAAMSAALMIAAFMCVTGFSPSMSRAGLVAGIGLAAWYYGRAMHPVVLLLCAAAFTALINPAYVWGDLGWYLSFTAFAGVIMLAPLVRAYFWGSEKVGAFWQILTDTLCAQIVTTPIILQAFGTLAMFALPANMLVLPFVPLAMLLVFLSGLAGLVFPAAAEVVGAPANALLTYMIGIIDYIASLPGAQKELSWTGAHVAVAYAVIVLSMLWLWRRTKYDFRG